MKEITKYGKPEIKKTLFTSNGNLLDGEIDVLNSLIGDMLSGNTVVAERMRDILSSDRYCALYMVVSTNGVAFDTSHAVKFRDIVSWSILGISVENARKYSSAFTEIYYRMQQKKSGFVMKINHDYWFQLRELHTL